MPKIEEVLESLSPIERQVLPHANEGSVEKIGKKTRIDKTTIIRALQFLEKKEIIKKKTKKHSVIELDANGEKYKEEGLPERKLVNLIAREGSIDIKNAKNKLAGRMDEKEFSAALGALKEKALIKLEKGIIIFAGAEKEEEKKFLEEKLLEQLPIKEGSLVPEQRLAYEKLKSRSGIIRTKEVTDYEIEVTAKGEDIARCLVDSAYENMIEQITTEVINNKEWKKKKFRRYDVKGRVPQIHGGKKHFVNQAVEYGRRVWTDMGFKEMTGKIAQTGFWNFDALYQPQDHPARELQDTFYIKGVKGKLPEKKLVDAVKKSHEEGARGSKGWQYSWREDEARRMLLRTHTTCLSAQTLAKLRELASKEKEGKYFALGMNFRNETLDWSHGFQFNQTEGIVIGKGLNFRHLLGYLKEFFKKMGYEKIRFRPHYFPYTEPSVEIDVWHPEKKNMAGIRGGRNVQA